MVHTCGPLACAPADDRMAAMPFPDPAFFRHAQVWSAVAPRHATGELAHDRHHVERVYRWALRLAPEAGADPDHAGAMALVHDVALVPKDGPDRALGGERSALLAGDELRSAGYTEAAVAAICDAVRTSSWSRGLAPAGPLGVVLQDADRLDALGALGLCRNLACAQFMSSSVKPGRFYDPEDPLAASGRPLDDRLQALDHLPAKLLKLAAGMRLPSARSEAAHRHAFLLAFREQVAQELAELRL